MKEAYFFGSVLISNPAKTEDAGEGGDPPRLWRPFLLALCFGVILLIAAFSPIAEGRTVQGKSPLGHRSEQKPRLESSYSDQKSAENPRCVVWPGCNCDWLRNSHWVLVACACFAGAIGIGGFWGGWQYYWRDNRRFAYFLGAIGTVLGLLGGLIGMLGQKCEYENDQGQRFHEREIVPQKQLTGDNYWGTVMHMANVLNTDKKIAAISALAEGSSIRSIERMTGVHRDTIMRLGVKVGQGCAKVMDGKMRNLPCNRLEMDEIWGFVGKKERNVRLNEPAPVGSVWTFCAIDAETKLVPAFKVGDRSIATATAFVRDVASRMSKRVQISTDGLQAYVGAIESAFGGEVDYAQIVKVYGQEDVSNNRRYSAPEFVSSEKKVIVGNPDERLISTSYVERLNATTRLHMRRLTRLTLAFSKKRENFEAAVALHFAYYNFVKRHNTLRCTPAMAAGVERNFWTVGDLLEAAA